MGPGLIVTRNQRVLTPFISRKSIGSRLDFAWAAVSRQGKVRDGIFPKAYHIKVAVRDRAEFWLSSGNWQSSNQPPLEVVPREYDAGADFRPILTKYNREWHVVVENSSLAETFDEFIRWDLDHARPLQETSRSLAAESWPELLVPIGEEDEDRALKSITRQRKKTFKKRLKVQPVLTPDNYPDIVAKLIEEATTSLRFQNQYINIGKTIPPGFARLLDVLKEKCLDGQCDVKIILRNIGDIRKMLVALQAYGFPVENSNMFRLQKSTHTKGIVVDDQRVLVGSHNWSGPGTTRNRDASLLVDDAEVAAYYAAIFDEDWNNLARAKALGNRDMPQLAHATRDAVTPPGFMRIPWRAYFEDVDDL